MQPISYARHQFPAEVIRHATWLYLRFTLSYRDVEELLAELPPRPGASSRCQLDDCRRTVKCGHGDERSNAGHSMAKQGCPAVELLRSGARFRATRPPSRSARHGALKGRGNRETQHCRAASVRSDCALEGLRAHAPRSRPRRARGQTASARTAHGLRRGERSSVEVPHT